MPSNEKEEAMASPLNSMLRVQKLKKFAFTPMLPCPTPSADGVLRCCAAGEPAASFDWVDAGVGSADS